MHLQQTKIRDKALKERPGGPQYYFHDVPDPIKDFLRRNGACPVVLETPYGIAPSPFMAVGRDHKLDANGRAVGGQVGHDRIQQAATAESIGEAIRRWYALPERQDFERIDVDVSIHPDGHFILTPLRATLRGRKKVIEVESPVLPLSFNRRHQSALWRDQIESLRETGEMAWIHDQIARVVDDHREQNVRSILEPDVLRTSGALSKLGLRLGPYIGKWYDCDPSCFQFMCLPAYQCPVEIKKNSRGFKYQMLRYKPLPRAVVLCVEHDLVTVPEHVDVIELAELSNYLARF